MKTEDKAFIQNFKNVGGDFWDLIKYAYTCGRIDAFEEAMDIQRNKKDKVTEEWLVRYYQGE